MAETRAQRADVSEPEEGGLDLAGLTGLLGFHIRMAQAAVGRDFLAALKALDLTQKQCAVLQLLETNPGASQIALGAALGTDRATMMALVDRLQDRGLLSRTRSTVDRRRQELHLTGDGRALLAEARRRIAAHERRFTQAFSKAELERLIGLLRRVYLAG